MKSVICASLAVCFACSGEMPAQGEVVGSQQQQFGTDQCASAGAVTTAASRFNVSFSAGYGSGCNASDVTSLDSANASNRAFITSPAPTNDVDCRATFIRADLYEWNGSSWSLVGEIIERGAWASIGGGAVGAGGAIGVGGSGVGGLGKCSVAAADFGRLTAGAKYRIAATARTYAGSSFTTLPFAVVTTLAPSP